MADNKAKSAKEADLEAEKVEDNTQPDVLAQSQSEQLDEAQTNKNEQASNDEGDQDESVNESDESKQSTEQSDDQPESSTDDEIDLTKQVGGTASNINEDGTVEPPTSDPSLTDAPEEVNESETVDHTQTTENPGGSNMQFRQNQIVFISRNNRKMRGQIVAQHGDKVEVVIGSNPEVHTVWTSQVEAE